MTTQSEYIVAKVRKALELPEDFALQLNLTPPEVPGWDSVGWLNIIMELEQGLDIEFNFEELEGVYNLQQLCDLIKKMNAVSG